MASGELLGKVTHFFDKINVAVIRLDRTVKAGESVRFLGRVTDFQQAIDSMQVEHQPVQEGAPGTEVAVKVLQHVHAGDSVYRANG